MNKKRLIALAAVLVLALSIFFTGCSNNAAQDDKGNDGNNASSKVSGNIIAVGSSALQPLVEKAAGKFMDNNPKANIGVQGGGSGTGLSQVSEGGCEIGNSDVFAEEKIKDEAKVKELVDHQVVAQGFAAIVNKTVKVDDLSKDQLKKIFTGEATNWSEVGGQDLAIVVVNRPTSSGTRATFVAKALDGAELVEGNTLTQDSNGAVLSTVSQTDGAISYLGLAYLNDSVKTLSVDGAAPTVDNIINGTYPVWSFGHMYTKGEPTGLTKAFLEYMESDEVAQIAREMNYIAGSDISKLKK